ncbi:DUF485 domain-containing protein [Planosporangium flavigriseum]|uniref:Membrane protein n=1 Tax=Planosporangium flavigriseum TaxID=373681 RepID=A0A8J3LF46_9ACTN|nr:DUF485 domain-containing protein [Planosporangium flavigriseum]NJC64580.1 DUF485 domain-containing protein [Planosporangium flavigriseum]GIG71937.1 membrane protein [Planosporangium flavigriseum]
MSTETPVPPGTSPASPAEDPSGRAAPDSGAYLAVEQSPEFASLRKALRSFVFPMTVAFFVWYALYVILSAYARGFMSVKIVGHINVALVFGLLQFVSTFLIAWLYSRYADRRLDPLAEQLRERVEGDHA